MELLIELARQVHPNVRRLTLLVNPANPNSQLFVKAFDDAGHLIRIAISPVRVRNAPAIETAIASLGAEPDGVLFVLPDSLPIAIMRSLSN